MGTETVDAERRWRDLPWRERFDPNRLTDGLPVFPLGVLFGLNAVDELDRTAFNVLLPEIKKSFGLNLNGVVALVTVAAVFALLIELPVAYWADRRRRTRIAAAGAAVWAFFTLLTGVSGVLLSLPLLYLARTGSVLGKTANATHLSLLSDYYPVTSRVKVVYAHRLANSLGQFAGPLIAGFLALWIGWKAPFFLLAAPTLIFVFMALRLHEPKRGMYERLAAGADQETAESEDDPSRFIETFRILWRNRSARRIYVSLPFLSAGSIGLSQLLSIYYDEEFGLDAGQRGILFASIEPIQIVAIVIGGIVVYRIALKSPGRAMFMLCLGVTVQSACLLVMAAAPSLWVAVPAHYVRSFFDAMLVPGIYALISFSVPPRMRTAGFATGNLWLLVGIPGLVAAGAVGSTWGNRAGLLVFTPIYLIGALVLGSSGKFLDADIETNQRTAREQAEERRASTGPKPARRRPLRAAGR
ncbi:MAG TPA: MFS transporter [Acidimicrobiales bacterium]|nr:MFS transporter [Acidimicrobiales bacterium]